jgi:threonyl-tRNA synthetase
VFCREEDLGGEVARFVALLSDVYGDFGFPEPEVLLSTRPLARAGADERWDWAEETLGGTARQCRLSYQIQPGEGAFYGPKLEFALRDRLGRSWQCGTVQLDSVLPSRLNASYVGPDGNRATPVMIHHAVFGSIGRFIAILLEHYAGALPFWLSPDQVAVAPISHDYSDYATKVLDVLGAEGVRASSSPVPTLCRGGSLPRMRRVFQSWPSSDNVKRNRAPLASESAPELLPFYR